MNFLESVLRFLDTQATAPVPFGLFHIICLLLTAAATVLAIIFGKNANPKQVRTIVLITAVVVTVLEIYKQINYTFRVSDSGIVADYLWYAFPWQFCSTPMYAGLLFGLTRKGRVHHAVGAYLATYAVFAGTAVMLYPVSVFTETVGINIQTMICHGTMIPIGALLYASGYVKAQHRTILRAACVFAVTVGIAVILNEVAHLTGLLNTDTFNMFFVSPYCEPSLPVYSLVQPIVPFPFSLIIYILGFTAAGYILLLIPILSIRLRSRFVNKANALTEKKKFAIMH